MLLKFKMRRGFSLVETLMVLVIVALLATISFPLYGTLRVKAGLAGCLSNMRIIGLGLSGYMQDNNMVWPQMPKGGFGGNDEALSKWWRDTLQPYGVAEKHWICPSDYQRVDEQTKKQPFNSSYGVCQFDDLPNTPFRWKQPWVMEHSGFHGLTRGPNQLMPDGTIQEGINLNSPATK